ncbi:hypothetical protein Slin15195_G063600 [Septoria linicola]|uniref:Transmembrane protein n=1 Tax=Septoria linicola TaxID=215465 RepID=A0A9Q9EIR0_9PEZI|nr:hypothetical protein Slin14017_G113910 [Septoria linicola]USW53041.1 hypothetical protein Slin15195_G063600 [Septoria linicola]
MGSDAYVALYAPLTLAPYVSLPSSIGGSTGYSSPTVSDVRLRGLRLLSLAVGIAQKSSHNTVCLAELQPDTPSPFTQLTSYRAAPTTAVQIDPSAIPGPSTYALAASYTAPATRSTNAIDNGSSCTVSATASLATASGQVGRGLSTGTKAGIDVGIGGGVFLLAAFGLCFFLAHRRKKTDTAQTAATAPVRQLYPGSPYSHMQTAPPYPYSSPPTQGSNWSGYPTAGVIPDPYHQRDIASPHSSILGDKPQVRPSFSSAGSDACPPTELAGEGVPPLHETGTEDVRQSGGT